MDNKKINLEEYIMVALDIYINITKKNIENMLDHKLQYSNKDIDIQKGVLAGLQFAKDEVTKAFVKFKEVQDKITEEFKLKGPKYICDIYKIKSCAICPEKECKNRE
jgi:hypothetical protein